MITIEMRHPHHPRRFTGTALEVTAKLHREYGPTRPAPKDKTEAMAILDAVKRGEYDDPPLKVVVTEKKKEKADACGD